MGFNEKLWADTKRNTEDINNSIQEFMYLPKGWDSAWLSALETNTQSITGIGDSIMAGQGASEVMSTSWWSKFRDALKNGKTLGGDFYSNLYSARYKSTLNLASPPVLVDGSATPLFGGYNQAVFSFNAVSPFVRVSPSYPVVGFDILYLDFQTDTWTYNVDGGSNTSVTTTGSNTNTASSVKKISISGLELGTHVLNINSGSVPNGCVILGVTCKSSITGMFFANMAWPGYGLYAGQAAKMNLIDTSVGPVDKLGLYQGYLGPTASPTALSGLGFPSQPDLAIVSLGVNDANQSVTRAQYRDTLLRLVWSLRFGKNDNCSIVIVAPYTANGHIQSSSVVPNMDYTGASILTYSDIKSAMREVAETQCCAFVDVQSAFGRKAVADGFITSATDIHPTNQGHELMSNLINSIL